RLGQPLVSEQGAIWNSWLAIVLHEYQVPDFNVPTAVRRARESALRSSRAVPLIRSHRTHVIMNLAARPARPGIAHLPKVVFHTERMNAFFGNTNIKPKLLRFVVPGNLITGRALNDGHVELVLRNAKPLRR